MTPHAQARKARLEGLLERIRSNRVKIGSAARAHALAARAVDAIEVAEAEPEEVISSVYAGVEAPPAETSSIPLPRVLEIVDESTGIPDLTPLPKRMPIAEPASPAASKPTFQPPAPSAPSAIPARPVVAAPTAPPPPPPLPTVTVSAAKPAAAEEPPRMARIEAPIPGPAVVVRVTGAVPAESPRTIGAVLNAAIRIGGRNS